MHLNAYLDDAESMQCCQIIGLFYQNMLDNKVVKFKRSVALWVNDFRGSSINNMAEACSSRQRTIKNAHNLKASIWKHFGFYEIPGTRQLDKTHAVCKACKTKIKYFGNTTNMRNHVSRWHAELPLAKSEKKTTHPAQPHTDESAGKLPLKPDRVQRITRCIGAFIAKDLRPYSVVENAGFRQLVRTLEPQYKIPSRQTIADTVVPALYKETKAQVMDSMREACRVAITCDSWTSAATESYLTVTGHYLNDDWEMVSHVLQTRAVCESHTGYNLAELLYDVGNEWQLSEKSVVLVTDNAPNMILAAQVGDFPHVRCFADTLNLACQRALDVAPVSRLMARIRHISTLFHRSAAANYQLKENQKLLRLKSQKLKTDVPSRWNSTYEMTQRFLEQQLAIAATLLSPEVRGLESDLATLTETEVRNAEDIIKALKVMNDVTQLMSVDENPTVCLIAPLKAQLIQEMSDTAGDTRMIQEVKQAIRTDLQKRYNGVTEKKMLHTASALDPRFKGLPFLSEEERLEVYSRVVYEAATLELKQNERTASTDMVDAPGGSGSMEERNDVLTVPEVQEEESDNERHTYSHSAPKRKASALLVSLLGQSFWNFEHGTAPPKTAHARAEEEMERYRKAPSLSLVGKPLRWWRDNKVIFPLLSRLAKHYLCIPGTSVAAERVFSNAGALVTVRRSSLDPEHVDQLLFLHKNLYIPEEKKEEDS